MLLHVITLDHVCVCHSYSLCHAPGKPRPNPKVYVSTPSSFSLERMRMRMNGGSRIRHPVCFICRREISVDSASFRERALTMPRRERWVWRRGGEGGHLSAGSTQLSLTSKTVKMSPSHPRQPRRCR